MGRQKEIVFRIHGGARRGAGRKPKGERPLVSHGARVALTGREPVLVTMKVLRHVWNLRARRAIERILPTLAAANERGLSLAHYSVQRDHLHLVVEPKDRRRLAKAVQGLAVRIARALNRMMQRTGKVFADRYHDRVLATPRQVRNALLYVLNNARKHGVLAPGALLDACSSAAAFDGWRGAHAERQRLARAHAPPVVAPRTWLLAIGWQRAGGPLDPDHRPGPLPV